MDKYFDKVLSDFSHIELMTEILFEFNNERNSIPSSVDIETFISNKKRELIERIKRFSEDEKTLLFDNLTKSYAKEYGGIRKYFLEEIQSENRYIIFPEHKNKKNLELSNREIIKLENHYSLYPCFQRVLNEMQIFIQLLVLNLPPEQDETKTNKLKVKQIALIYVYEGLHITRQNAKEIAAQYGYKARNSGEGLFQDYTNYCSTANRKGKPTACTPKKLQNKIELFESIVNHLSENNKQKAIDEIRILKTLLESEYS
ncbi:MAG: hypothetical protein ACK4WD_01500 [Flavobacteriales bacterium]|jgi:hypothetical protein